MIFTGKHNGYEVTVSCWNDGIAFRCDAIQHNFNSMAELERALNAYDLKLRKQFSNRIAWMKSGWNMNGNGKIDEVEITSVTDDDAWVKRKGKREKARRDALFADREALLAVIDQEQQWNDQIKQQWESLKRWEPQP